jgi:hypothetical protein
MKGLTTAFLICFSACLLLILPAISQAPDTAEKSQKEKKKKAPENLPWTRFHPAAPPYQPSIAEKEQIQAKLDELDRNIRERDLQ